MIVNIEDPVEVRMCVKGVPVCYVHIDGSITYLSQIVSIFIKTYIKKIQVLLFICFLFLVLEINCERYMYI